MPAGTAGTRLGLISDPARGSHPSAGKDREGRAWGGGGREAPPGRTEARLTVGALRTNVKARCMGVAGKGALHPGTGQACCPRGAGPSQRPGGRERDQETGLGARLSRPEQPS